MGSMMPTPVAVQRFVLKRIFDGLATTNPDPMGCWRFPPTVPRNRSGHVPTKLLGMNGAHRIVLSDPRRVELRRARCTRSTCANDRTASTRGTCAGATTG